MTSRDIFKLKRNDLDAAVKLYRAGKEAGWLRPEHVSTIARLFDDPAKFLAAVG